MRDRLTCLLLAGLAIGGWSGLATAEDAPPSVHFHVIFEEHPKPWMLDAYEASAREFAAMVGAHREEMPHFVFTTLQGEDLTIYYVAEVDDYAGIDQINREYNHLAAAMGGESFYRKMNESIAAASSLKTWVVSEGVDSGYQPANLRLKPEEEKFYAFEYFYLLTGHDAEVAQLVRDWADLYRRKGIADGFRVFRGVMGIDGPVLIVSVGARDAVDYETQQAKIRATLGADAEPLIKRTWAVTDRYEIKRAVARPDLSIPALAPAEEGAR